jgi:hypothetical protein
MRLFIIVAIILVVFLATVGLIGRIVKRSQAKFINPLTKSMRRPPGAELGRKLGAAQLEAGFDALELVLAGMVLPFLVAVVVINSQSPSSWYITVALAAAVGLPWLFLSWRKLIKRIEQIRTLRLGYECELAVGQELDLLMMNGWQVFHDLPADGFNIDHVVVGSGGVFAVETKGRSKSLSGDDGKKSFRVKYEAGLLHFPTGKDAQIVEQAERQAKWLSSWLSSATGEPTRAQPLVVLPGWYVELKDQPKVPVIASGYIPGFFSRHAGTALDNSQIKRICHQLDRAVRDLPPGEVVRPARSS